MQGRCVDAVGGDADVGRAVGDGLHDVAAEAFLQVDAQLRMAGEEGGQRVWQKLGHGGGVAEQAYLAFEAGGELRQVGLHVVHLPGDGAGVVQQRAARLGGFGAAPAALQQRHVQGFLHAAYAGAGRGQRQVRQPCAGGNAAAFRDVDEQLEVGQVEAHGISLWIMRSLAQYIPDFQAGCGRAEWRTWILL